MVARAYCRCTSGHYFIGEACPLDGWSSPACTELAEAVRMITANGRGVSLAELQRIGVSQGALSRTIIIEFGSPSVVFDALVPEGYVVGDQYRRLRDMSMDFM